MYSNHPHPHPECYICTFPYICFAFTLTCMYSFLDLTWRVERDLAVISGASRCVWGGGGVTNSSRLNFRYILFTILDPTVRSLLWAEKVHTWVLTPPTPTTIPKMPWYITPFFYLSLEFGIEIQFCFDDSQLSGELIFQKCFVLKLKF